MQIHLDTVATKIRLQLSQAVPDTSSHRILSLLNDLTNAIQMSQEDDPENTWLRTQVEKLSAVQRHLNETINWQAGILQAVKDALEADASLTMTQLPFHAKSIMAWAKTGTKPL